MQVVPNHVPSPRLLSSAVIDQHRSSAANAKGAKLARGGFWSGNGFAIFVGIALGALFVCGVSTFLITRHAASEEVAPARLVPINSTPAPIADKAPRAPEQAPASSYANVDVPLDALRITSISLGHPRLAVINRQQVAEGDWLYVTVGSSQVRARLRVISIADGQVQLTLGKRVLTVPLHQLKLKAAR